ncbi:MAG: UDP-N-acetylmuramoyl-tripeptide--D-alanyl-D-alanine ligase [Cryomorphaceae bacterium]|nr:UDP-N-acetylmuramoyl-tripeptide--D-alanyl-D-alanine ligase [Cryomorphaceae bacterium]
MHLDLINHIYKAFLNSTGVSIDSRSIREGSIFFALRGDNFDGNQFAHEAIANGASYAVVDSPWFSSSENVFKVPDVLLALQEIATLHRQRSNATVIGLTGSNGKTTTKELIYAVLRQTHRVLATEGNLNNHIGVPLTLLRIRPEHEYVIVEMGASSVGEIEMLSEITKPDVGLITNYGKAHLEGFGSPEGVIQGKSELFEYLRKRNGVAIVNADDDIQMKRSEGMQRYTYGLGNVDCFIDLLVGEDPFLRVIVAGTEIETQMTGIFNYSNIASAAALSCYLSIPMSAIKKGIHSYIPGNNRSQWVETGSNKVFLDAYNANPTSVEASLLSLTTLEGNRCAIIGDMFELGLFAKQEHKQIANTAVSLGIEKVILVGEIFNTVRGLDGFANLEIYQNMDNLRDRLIDNPITNSIILLKGSRGMKMESLLEIL